MSSSGTLLLTWVDTSDTVKDLRRRCRQAFPGASTKQASIIHTSLVRVVSAKQLPQATKQAVLALCKRWTGKLKGTLYSPDNLWLLREVQYTTLLGEREVLDLLPPSPSSGGDASSSKP